MSPLQYLNTMFLLGTFAQVVHVPVMASVKRRSVGLWLLVALMWVAGAAYYEFATMLVSPDDFWIAGAVGMLPTWVLALTPARAKPTRGRTGRARLRRRVRQWR